MTNLLYIEITKNIPFGFQKSELISLKEKWQITDAFDLDNHSETMMIEYACEFVRRSEKLIIYIQAEENADTMRLASVFDTMVKEKNKISIICSGDNSQLQRWLKPVSDKIQH